MRNVRGPRTTPGEIQFSSPRMTDTDKRTADRMMPEAEVSLRLAFWLIERGLTREPVSVSLDGAQIKTADRVHFDLVAFLAAAKWRQCIPSLKWQCDWVHENGALVRIHSNPGQGDVVARLCNGYTLRVESKKGPMARSRSSAEYPLLREALGQLLTIREVSDSDILAVAVPHTPKFEELAERWRHAPLVTRFGIQILTVSRHGDVSGLALAGAGQSPRSPRV